jgi:hypothetical protein
LPLHRGIGEVVTASLAEHAFHETCLKLAAKKASSLHDGELTKGRETIISSTGCFQHVDKEHLEIGTDRTKARGLSAELELRG